MNKSKFNKKQIFLIILSIIVLGLYFSGGMFLPITHPINIITCILLLIIFLVLVFIIIKPRYCPNCNTQLPRIRRPLDENEALYGWTTCPKCKSQIDTRGNIVKKR